MEHILSEIKSRADKVMKKSGELVEKSKVKLAIAGTKSEIGSLFKQLGELVYLAQKDETGAGAEEIENTIAHIDVLYEKLEELTQADSALKNEKICAQCGKSNPMEQTFCGGCGNKFPENEEPAQEGEVLDDIPDVETV